MREAFLWERNRDLESMISSLQSTLQQSEEKHEADVSLLRGSQQERVVVLKSKLENSIFDEKSDIIEACLKEMAKSLDPSTRNRSFPLLAAAPLQEESLFGIHFSALFPPLLSLHT